MKSLISIFCLLFAYSVSAQTKVGDFHIDKEYKISPTGLIKLNSSDAKVTITGSTRSGAHVKIDREVTTKGLTFGHEEFAVDVSEENGNLNIRERSNSMTIGVVGYHYEKYTITIEAPEGTSLQVKGDDGDYWIRNIDGSISLSLDDADVELSGCSGDNFEFRLDDGDIVMDEGKGRLDIDADDADVKIQHARFTSIRAEIDDGDLVIETSLADTGDYRIRSQDGLVALTITQGGGQFDIRHDDTRMITEGNFQEIERSDNHTSLTLATGSAKVDIRADDGRVRLTKK